MSINIADACNQSTIGGAISCDSSLPVQIKGCADSPFSSSVLHSVSHICHSRRLFELSCIPGQLLKQCIRDRTNKWPSTSHGQDIFAMSDHIGTLKEQDRSFLEVKDAWTKFSSNYRAFLESVPCQEDSQRKSAKNELKVSQR